jgi:hypothetical protein
VAGLAFDDADEQQRQPGEQDVGADAVLEAMEDRAQFDRGLQVAEAAFGFEEVLVAQRDVLGRQVGIAGGQQELAIQLGFGVDLGAVDAQPAGRGLAQVAPERGVVA